MDTLGQFGLEPFLFIAQLVNFLIIGYVLWRFLLKPMLTSVRLRKDKIAQGLADAERARRALADANRERDVILGQAYSEAARVLETARAEAERVRTEATERARADAERVAVEIRARTALEVQAAEKDVESLALGLSGRILDHVVTSLFTQEEKAQIVARGLEQIRSFQ